MQHFIGYPTNSSYLCGEDSIVRRNTRTDTDPTLTTCRACKVSPHFPTEETPHH
ncbi:hypothetical protein [Specibacter sp. NPDC078692]|uniref:hypothetical protein n=1 Tax=Specibacter sp. NPDC078692 TaxID=3155818 RepID=UPI0034365FB9